MKKRTAKVIQKWASYTSKVIKTGLTPSEAIELRDKLMKEYRQQFVAFDAVWDD